MMRLSNLLVAISLSTAGLASEATTLSTPGKNCPLILSILSATEKSAYEYIRRSNIFGWRERWATKDDGVELVSNEIHKNFRRDLVISFGQPIEVFRYYENDGKTLARVVIAKYEHEFMGDEILKVVFQEFFVRGEKAGTVNTFVRFNPSASSIEQGLNLGERINVTTSHLNSKGQLHGTTTLFESRQGSGIPLVELIFSNGKLINSRLLASAETLQSRLNFINDPFLDIGMDGLALFIVDKTSVHLTTNSSWTREKPLPVFRFDNEPETHMLSLPPLSMNLSIPGN